MGYRDPTEALMARRDALRATLRGVGEAERDELARDLAQVEAAIDAERTRIAHRILGTIRVAAPCDASWDAMVGDDRIRSCAICDKHVYNLSGMTAREALSILQTSDKPCVRLYKRADGSVITSDCEVGIRKRRRRLAIAATASAAIAATAGLAPSALASLEPRPAFDSSRMITMGGAEREEPDPDEARVMMGAGGTYDPAPYPDPHASPRHTWCGMEGGCDEEPLRSSTPEETTEHLRELLGAAR
ncbi:MAG: hypothetical protein K8H88_05735 [Sandaracinaceae bacterium]|nr:hypothetical protein [Sandaracinaceae bacterium]